MNRPNLHHLDEAAAAAAAASGIGTTEDTATCSSSSTSRIPNVTISAGPLAPPTPDLAANTAIARAAARAHLPSLGRRSMSLGAENTAAADHADRDDSDEALCHTPMTTRYTHLPDLHQRDLDALLLETGAGARPPIRTRSFPRVGRRKVRVGAGERKDGRAGRGDAHEGSSKEEKVGGKEDVVKRGPMTTRYAHLPDLHQRDLDALLLEGANSKPIRTRSFPREGRRRVRVSDHRGDAREGSSKESGGAKDGAVKRSRSKSLGNEHERIITASYEGYRDAETKIKKKKARGSYGSGGRGGGIGGGMGKSMAAYVLSRYGRDERDVEQDVEEEEEEEEYMMVDESTYLLAASGEQRFEEEGGDAYDASSQAAAQSQAQAQIDAADPFATDPDEKPNPPTISITYGLINTAIVLPVLISFGSIIYHDDFFRPYLPLLVKLTVVSGTVHQICFSTWSSLTFAVGQVQDAGLIFLSKMASDMVRRCKDSGGGDVHIDDEAILATVTIGLALCTALLGFGLVIIGYFRLASTVQLLPTPVVGGYLAFIGFFCGQGGLSIMAGFEVSGILEWGAFFHLDIFKLIIPGVICGITIYVLVRRLRHMAVLPCCIAGMMLAFYVVLTATDTTLQEARDGGWMSQAEPPPVWYHTWSYLRFDRVVWSALPPQIPTLIGMTFVVALSSSLDVAAIELELKRPLNYNHELKTVGISNVVSGLTGGYTGSYIFSQSIFSLRSGIRSRLSGYVVALSEAVVIVLPINILSYVPNFFFGSLLIMICVDLMVEWLWEVRHKMAPAEYGVALGTFVLIQLLGVEWGILAGIAVYFVGFKCGLNMRKNDESIVVQDADDGAPNGNINSPAINGGGYKKHLSSRTSTTTNNNDDISMTELVVDAL